MDHRIFNVPRTFLCVRVHTGSCGRGVAVAKQMGSKDNIASGQMQDASSGSVNSVHSSSTPRRRQETPVQCTWPLGPTSSHSSTRTGEEKRRSGLASHRPGQKKIIIRGVEGGVGGASVKLRRDTAHGETDTAAAV